MNKITITALLILLGVVVVALWIAALGMWKQANTITEFYKKPKADTIIKYVHADNPSSRKYESWALSMWNTVSVHYDTVIVKRGVIIVNGCDAQIMSKEAWESTHGEIK